MSEALRIQPRFYLGQFPSGTCWADPQQAVLVLGPPRAGKTSSLVIPNVVMAPGAVVSTSTKPDVLEATIAQRRSIGRCWLFDPTGEVNTLPGVTPIRWSPVDAAHSWDESLLTARAMVLAARPWDGAESSHWSERAEALIAPLLHAANLSGAGMRGVTSWVLRHDISTPKTMLRSSDSDMATEVLDGIAATEERERSGIWSTAAGVLAPYRSEGCLERSSGTNFDPASMASSSDTVYICSSARHQSLVAPIIVAFLEQVRAGVYASARTGQLQVPVTLALDEVANIAPLPDLPAMVSEGGGQGLLIMACLQDLSQARSRWGTSSSDGFMSLFGAKVILPGIGDMATLQTVSRLAGDMDVQISSVTSGSFLAGTKATKTWSLRRQPRLPVDVIHSLRQGMALAIVGPRPPTPIALTPWWSLEGMHPVMRRAAPDPELVSEKKINLEPTQELKPKLDLLTSFPASRPKAWPPPPGHRGLGL